MEWTTFAHNCMLFGRTETELPPPEDCPPEDMDTVFRWGQCHSFALAAQEVLGYGVIVGTGLEENEDGVIEASHFVLEIEDGDEIVWFDVTGVHEPDPWCEHESWLPDQIAELSDPRPGVGSYFALQVEDAKPYAKHVAREAGLLPREEYA
jgi:hypothetical protein